MSDTLSLTRRRSWRGGTAAEAPTVRVAVAGRGAVGGALLRLLRDGADSIQRAHAVRFEVVRVLARDPDRTRPAPVPAGTLTTDVEAFTETDADLVVEAIGGLEPARQIALRALARRRDFVTANKALVAAHGPELEAVARRQGASFSYEAAVAGGVPVIRVLRQSLRQAGILSIRGILNGTTNFILVRMAEGLPFDAALRDARTRGFAEADPTRDLSGQDAADKIAILAWEAFGIPPGRLPVHRAGLLPHPDRIVADARALDGTARLVAEAVRRPDGVAAAVEPTLVDPGSAYGTTVGEDNLVVIETRSNGTIRLAGPGAGGEPTASAVLSDMLGAVQRRDRRGVEAIRDRRSLLWAISVKGGANGRATLERTAERARVAIDVVEAGAGSGVTRAITGPARRSRVALLSGALEAAGVQPVLLRREMGWDR
jgi:homoserine dehydrogenase